MQEKLYISTGNKSKFAELAYFTHQLFPKKQILMQSVPGLEETGSTFVENARLKAEALTVSLQTKHNKTFYVLADDSGLCVAGLGGAPGLYSARYSGQQASDMSNMQKLLKALEQLSDSDPGRKAFFVCALVLLRIENAEITECIAEGRMHGLIARSPSGTEGFGYDPVFIPDGHGQSLATLSEAEKAKISHRSRAFAKLKTAL